MEDELQFPGRLSKGRMCIKEICDQVDSFVMRTHALKYKCTFGVQWEKKGWGMSQKMGQRLNRAEIMRPKISLTSRQINM